MKKIIKEKKKDVREFECEHCGTVFESDEYLNGKAITIDLEATDPVEAMGDEHNAFKDNCPKCNEEVILFEDEDINK